MPATQIITPGTVSGMVPRTCPYCGAFADFEVRATWERPDRVPMGVWACRSCHWPITGTANNNGEPSDVQPVNARKMDFPDVPSSIADDAAEAFHCLVVSAWRAVAAMARRAIQQSCLEKGAPAGKRLVDQIDWLADQQLISPQMKAVAHRLRIIGNLGAHPDKDGLEDVDQAQAEATLVFLTDFLRYVYQIPASLDRIAPPPAP